MNVSVCRNSRPNGTSTNICKHHVTRVAKTITKATAADIPSEVLTFWLTPRNGQMPRNWLSTILFTNIAAMNISIYSMSLYYGLWVVLIFMLS